MTGQSISRLLWKAILDGEVRTAADAAHLVDLLADRPDAVVKGHLQMLRGGKEA